ncbi:MAG: hypothetical protein JST39_25400, partial [Bacteroidetes bacterium]|nr:hypothetical protein [Bacteroidota bacterium]
TTVHYQRLYLSATWLCRWGYYLRKPGLQYYAMFYQQNGGTPAYYKRWRAAGDELKTSIPSQPVLPSQSRDLFDQFSTANIIPAANIRLQALQLGWCWPGSNGQTFMKVFRELEVSLTVANPGVLFLKNRDNIDPDLSPGELPPVRSFVFTIKSRF